MVGTYLNCLLSNSIETSVNLIRVHAIDDVPVQICIYLCLNRPLMLIRVTVVTRETLPAAFYHVYKAAVM